MGQDTKIEWAHHTFNIRWGCTKVSAACDFCYAEAWDKRLGGAHWGPHAPRRQMSDAYWRQPLKWDAAAAKAGRRARVFCSSMADVFENVDDGQLQKLWPVIRATPRLDWLLLTKRPQNIAKMLPSGSGPIWRADFPNIWLGTTVENQEEADRRLPHLRPFWMCGFTTFVSYEPALGPVDWAPFANATSWLISGGESGGPRARLSHPDWHRAARDFCAKYDIPYLFKQWGEWLPGENYGETLPWPPARWQDGETGLHSSCAAHQTDGRGPEWRHFTRPGDPGAFALRVGKKRAGRLLDGVEHLGFPELRA